MEEAGFVQPAITNLQSSYRISASLQKADGPFPVGGQ
jgi:hypothetical protein